MLGRSGSASVDTMNSLQSIRNVFLDWSGTIVDDLPPVLEATNRVMDYYKKPSFTREQFRRDFCLPFVDFYDRFLPGISMSELDALYTEFFDSSDKQVTELPGARVFLDYCLTTGKRIFLLSSIKNDHFETQAKALGLRRYFDHAYTEVLNKSLRIHGILQDLELDSHETLFAGDMQHDVETAKCANLLAVATLTGYNSREQLNAAAPDLIVDDLSFLVEGI
jgi:phosphoglycolate phosphatase